MGKRKAETKNVGKGKVTPIQVAFIVDRYLADNNYSQTRTAFRSEASNFLHKFPLHQASKTLLSLGAMLDEYISLKEQKVILDQEKYQLEQEKFRVQTLLQGMQDVMNVYNHGAANGLAQPPPPPPSTAPAPAIAPLSSAGCHVYRSPAMTSVSMSTMTHSVKLDHTNFSTPLSNPCPRRKRRNYKDLPEAPQAPKKPCIPLPTNQLLSKGNSSVAQLNTESNGDHKSLSPDFAQGGSPVQGSGVAKNLFNKPSQSPTSNSSGPKTPPRAVSSQSDKSISPLEEVSSTAKSHHSSTPPETTPTNCTIISSKTIIVSPTKHYSIERNHCTISSPAKSNLKRQSKRDHVKGRLDFDGPDMPSGLENTSGDGSSTSESEKEGDILDLDLPNFDAFGPNFSLTELLTDFGIDCGALDYSCPTSVGCSMDAISGSLCEVNNGELGTSQGSLEHSSAMTETFAGDQRKNGADSITSVKSITKCIRIVSPTKSSPHSSSS